MAVQHAIRIYSATGTLLRVLRGGYQSARYRLAENEVGDFDLTVPWGDGTLPVLLSPPNLVEFWRDNAYVFGGYIRKQSIKQDGRQPFYTVSGPSYLGWLSDADMKSTTGTGDITVGTGHLDDLMKAAVRSQVLDQPQLFVCAADSGLSAVSDTYVATGYEKVIETLQGMATRAGDTSFDIIRDSDRALRFRTWTPSRGPDKSKGHTDAILFDMRGGNIISAEWTRDGNNVVNALRGAGGVGDKAARYVYPVSDDLLDAQSILDWGRIEGFVDTGNESTTNVNKKVTDELAKQAVAEETVQFAVSEFGRYALGDPTLVRHFDFGTKVTVVWGNILEFTDTIRGIEVKLDEGSKVASIDINVGGTITGDSTTKAMLKLGKYLSQLRRSISVTARH